MTNLMNTKIIMFRNVLPCSTIDTNRRRQWSCCFSLSFIYVDVVTSRLF